MKLFFTILSLLFTQFFYGQVFTNNTGGAIPDAATTPTCFPVIVSGVGNINGTYGLQSVCVNITHTYDMDLTLWLQAPDGSSILLSQNNGGSGNNYTNTCFNMTAANSIVLGTPPFTGSFIPEGNIGWFNSNVNANGVWSLCILDDVSGDIGNLNNFSITFNNTAAPYPGVGCTGNAVASPFCQTAPGICNLNGYCGNTSATYAPPHVWPELLNAFCGSIENNSFVQFVASATTATFNVNVTNSQNGDGIQFMVYSGGCGSGAVTPYGCINQMSPGANVFTATGLTPGVTYYLMIDGYAGDICNYAITAASGVNIFSITPANPVVCLGNGGVSMTATGGNGTYNWSPATNLNTTSGATVIATPTVAGTTTYTVTTGAFGAIVCPLTKTVTVTASPKPVVSNPTSVCAGNTGTLTPNTGGTWVSSNTAVATVTNAGVYTGVSAGTATFTFTDNITTCSNTTSNVTIIPGTTPTFTAIAPICSGSTAPVLPTTSTNGITGTWNPATVSNTATATYTFNPTVGLCATTATLGVTVNPNITPTFAAIAPICSGSAAPVLPTTSTNGITGTWNPATVSNTATATYTFNPTVGLCAVSVVKTVTVNPNITPTFTAIAPICSGSTAPVLPTTSTNGITGTWNPATVSNQSSNSYLFTPNVNNTCAGNFLLPIFIIPKPVINFGNTTRICEGSSYVLNATNVSPLATYLWQNGSTNPTFTVTEGGTYSVVVNNGLCSSSKSIAISIDSFPKFILKGRNTICPGETILLNAVTSQSTGNSYLWNNGNTNPSIFVGNPDTYSVKVTNNCGSASKSITVNSGICSLYMPNAFSPNSDTKNDYYRPAGDGLVKDFTMELYNRWGQKIFVSRDVKNGWDGKLNSKDQPVDTYVYVVEYTEIVTGNKRFLKGNFILVR